jgi:peptide/nickel transport system ATP-binding protein
MIAKPMTAGPVLSVRYLSVELGAGAGAVPVLRGVDLEVGAGRIHGLVGESGAGKTMVARAIMDLLPESARITAGDIGFEGRSLLSLDPGERRGLLGTAIAMIMQNPMTALNPVRRIGQQMAMILQRHLALGRRDARARALAALDSVSIREPARVLDLYPHEISGGMCQRVLIALAFACEPRLIIADEPTTALDVTVQRQVLRLLKEMQSRTGVAVVFVTHDLGVVAKICDSASVMFAGRVLETAEVSQLMDRPQHPYTAALFAATPRYDRPDRPLRPIPAELRERLLAEAKAADATGHRHV